MVKFSYETMEKLFDQGLLGNYAQSLGISGRGTKKELIAKIYGSWNHLKWPLRIKYKGASDPVTVHHLQDIKNNREFEII